MFDIIGDIHGHADELKELLQKLGYSSTNGAYKHPNNRKVVFLGDYIDRGPKIRETLHIVKDMCDAGNAYAIMGNHEFNAICFHTLDSENGGYYRKHGISEIIQHIETLKDFQKYPEELYDVFLPWFHTLPIFLEFDLFRVVHACWDDKQVEWLKENNIYTIENGVKKISDTILAMYAAKNTEAFTVLEELLKGKEYELPADHEFIDPYGIKRQNARIKWFHSVHDRNYHRDVFLGVNEVFGNVPLSDELKQELHSYESEITVFFGHYWLEGKPVDPNSNSICLDYSVAKKGHLVGYRFDTKEFVIV